MVDVTQANDNLDELIPSAKVALKRALVPNEVVKVIITGAWDQAIIGTDSRLFIFKKGLMGGVTFGTKMTSWHYHNLTGIKLETEKQTGFVAIQGMDIPIQDLSFWSSGKNSPETSLHAIPIVGTTSMKKAQLGVEIIRDLMKKEKTDRLKSLQAPSVNRKIGKLAALQKQGLISQEEFESQQNAHLSRKRGL